MRTLSSASAVTVAAAATLLLAPAAYADGDHGTVTMHDATTDALLEQDEPRVCTFTLHGSGFDVRRSVGWKIVEMPPTGVRGRVAEVGGLSVDEEGRLRSGTLSLEDGRYRLVWKSGRADGPAGRKVFWIDCDGVPERGEVSGADSGEPSGPASAETTSGPEDSPGPEDSTVPGPDTTDDADGPGTGDGPPGATPSPRVPPGGGSDLAETGSGVPAGALAAAGASLLGAGAYLVLRRREPGQRD